MTTAVGARVAVYSSSWSLAPQSEIAVAARSLAGAASRLASVDVFVPGGGDPFADGAFEVTPAAGTRINLRPYAAVLVEAGVATTSPDLSRAGRVLSIGSSTGGGAPAAVSPDGVIEVGLGTDAEVEGRVHDDGVPRTHRVGLYTRVHPGAKSRRHYGLGTIPDYLLVLGDRTGSPATPWPSDRARWLLARFPREYVVVVEGGVARGWRSRSMVAAFEVHTRTDLWILMAQAKAVVDLLPGDLFARECVEALRYGVPIVVPGGTVAEGLALAGGGLRFSSTAELLSCTEALTDRTVRESLGSTGRDVADHWYGDPEGFVTRLAGVLGFG